MSEQAKTRLLERHASATIRAISGQPKAEFRHQRLRLGKHNLSLKTSHLVIDPLKDSLPHWRGVADSLSLRLKHSNQQLHQRLMPEDYLAQLIFDTLEQLRVESLSASTLPGMASNLDQSFLDWSRRCAAEGITENHAGLIVFTLAQVARSKLLGQEPDREVTALIEEPQYKLGPHVGHLLARLAHQRHDQALYASTALEIANIVNELLDLDNQDSDQIDETIRRRLPMPPDEEEINAFSAHLTSTGERFNSADDDFNNYRIFTRKYDRIVPADKLYSETARSGLREQLDKQIAAQVISIPRLALRLQKLFGSPAPNGWDFGQDQGVLDGRRLSQLVSNPDYHSVFKRDHLSPQADAVVTFLIDNSGSMKRQRFETVAVLVDIYCQALELAGVKTEILGFSTASWNGGAAIKDWRKAGQPANPGRLNECLFIIYKDANTRWRRARNCIAALLNTLHYREGIDGEALQWACSRLAKREEKNKAVIVISDGAPMDSATANTNHDTYLAEHLYDVTQMIENKSRIQLRSIGIDLDMSGFFEKSINLDLTGTLDNYAFSALELLFDPEFNHPNY